MGGREDRFESWEEGGGLLRLLDAGLEEVCWLEEDGRSQTGAEASDEMEWCF